MKEPVEASKAVPEDIFKAFKPHSKSLTGLRNRVLGRLLFVALIPLLILALYLRYQFITTLESRSEIFLQAIAKGRQGAVDQMIAGKMAALKSLAKLVDPAAPASDKEMKGFLALLQGMDESILDLGLFDALGNHIRYAGPFQFLEGKNYKDENWFMSLTQSESPFFISDVYLGYRNDPHFMIAYRMESGDAPWFLRITISPAKFNQLVNDVQVIEGVSALIVNREAVCQCAPENICRTMSKTPVSPQMNAGSGATRIHVDNDDYLLAWSRLKYVNWTLIVRQNLAVANAPIRAASRVVLIILIFAILFIIISSVLATRSLMNRYARVEKDRTQLIDQLFQAGKLSTMGEMAAGVAHEINNPLAVILSELGVMEDILDPTLSEEFDREEFSKRIESAKQEIRRCRNITHKLLGLSRHSESVIDKHDVNEVVTETVGLIKKELSFENIQLLVDADPAIPVIRTDGEKIKQVALNMIRNAKDAIGKDGKITVSTHNEADYVSIIITDTGSGISERNLQKIFMPFFTTKEVGKGTGLGLSISYGIITSLGGKINVTSKVGEGTSFEIILPKKNVMTD